VAREEAGKVAGSASDKATDVAQTAMEQAKEVAADAAAQARTLAEELRSQIDEQSVAQRDRVVGTLRSLGDEVDAMVRNSGQSGMASDLMNQMSGRVNSVADYLDGRQPGEMFADLKNYARQRPGAFLIGAAIAGVLAGRLTRGARAAASDSDSPNGSPSVDVTPVSVGDPLYDGPGPVGPVRTGGDLAPGTTSGGTLAPESLDYPASTQSATGRIGAPTYESEVQV
jgi:hypothetical protein